MAVVKAGIAQPVNAIYRCMGYVLLLFAGGNAPQTIITLCIYKVQNYGIYGHQEVGFHPFSPLDRALSHRQ